MRNELMQRMPMKAATQQMAAAPPMEQEEPTNPLMQRRGPEREPAPDQDPTSIFLGKAKALGIDVEGALAGGADQKQVLDQAMKAIWKAEPTDENSEMIEQLSQHLGIPPPWQEGDGGMMKLGGPQEYDKEAADAVHERFAKNGFETMMHATDVEDQDTIARQQFNNHKFYSPSAERFSSGLQERLQNYWDQRYQHEKSKKR